MNKELSDRIKIASFLCTIMVIFRHSLNHVAFWGEWRGDIMAGVIEGGFSTVTEIAVPYFFLVSGFFFFKHSYYEKGEYLTMLKKKGYTLFIPYLIWSIIGLIEQIVAGQYHKTDIHDILYDLVLSEWNGPLWYVRTLMTFMVLVPIYGWLYSLKNKMALVVALCGAFYIWRTVDCSILSTEGIIFFLFGGLLSCYGKYLEYKINVKLLIVLLILWVIISFVRPCWTIWVHKANTLLGIFVFWQLLSLCSDRFKSVVLPLSSLSFFVYVNHIYPLKAIKLTIASLYPRNEVAALAVYFIAPIIVLIIFLFIGNLMRRYTPNILNIMMGGRI